MFTIAFEARDLCWSCGVLLDAIGTESEFESAVEAERFVSTCLRAHHEERCCRVVPAGSVAESRRAV
ncbi:MAG: hypothetical protein ACF8XB_08840 [Planctomycetota bacterium JB042]